ncbi:hypothetical protein E2562_011960 [Oryza meyeriana var. granulata]|uniref:Uncharacterized protein n=1 Tax=Oryza meyeriana var. granulata TaxID=110450 RepID=A0A6G1F6V5_9ORYZ|nr:hypothetical protein E2562_011960 [Oryza meyeriana var. granulata]
MFPPELSPRRPGACRLRLQFSFAVPGGRAAARPRRGSPELPPTRPWAAANTGESDPPAPPTENQASLVRALLVNEAAEAFVGDDASEVFPSISAMNTIKVRAGGGSNYPTCRGVEGTNQPRTFFCRL